MSAMTDTLINDMEIAAKVEKGAAELDRIFPDWQERINLHRLSLRDGIQCVLGQLYGAFIEGSRQLGWSYEECDAFGFFYLKTNEMSFAEFDESYRPYYNEAQECWLGQIADRLRGDK